MTDANVTDLLRRWQEGDQAAAFALDRQFHSYLLHLVRRHRGGPPGRLPSEDVVNDALRSFLSYAQKDCFPAHYDDHLIRKLLVAFVWRTLRDHQRHEGRARRDARREESSDRGRPDYLTDTRGEAPEEGAARKEFEEHFPGLVRSVHARAMDILERHLDGLDTREIAAELEMGLRTVQGILAAIRAAVTHWAAGETDHGN